MNIDFLKSLQRLKRDLDEGRLSPEEYAEQRKKILDQALEAEEASADSWESETQSELLGYAEDTVSELLEDLIGVDRTDEPNTVSELLDRSVSGAETMPIPRPEADASQVPDSTRQSDEGKPARNMTPLWAGLGVLTLIGVALYLALN